MLIKIGDRVFNPSDDGPITIYLTDKDRDALQEMPDESHYLTLGGKDYDHEKWISEFKEFVADYEASNAGSYYYIARSGKYSKPDEMSQQIQSVINTYSKDQKLDLLHEQIEIARNAKVGEDYRFLQEWKDEETDPFIKKAIADTFQAEIGHNIDGDAV